MAACACTIASATSSAESGSTGKHSRCIATDVANALAFLRKDGTLQNLVIRTPSGFGTTDDYNGGNVIAFLRPWEEGGRKSFTLSIRFQPGARVRLTGLAKWT